MSKFLNLSKKLTKVIAPTANTTTAVVENAALTPNAVETEITAPKTYLTKLQFLLKFIKQKGPLTSNNLWNEYSKVKAVVDQQIVNGQGFASKNELKSIYLRELRKSQVVRSAGFLKANKQHLGWKVDLQKLESLDGKESKRNKNKQMKKVLDLLKGVESKSEDTTSNILNEAK